MFERFRPRISSEGWEVTPRDQGNTPEPPEDVEEPSMDIGDKAQ